MAVAPALNAGAEATAPIGRVRPDAALRLALVDLTRHSAGPWPGLARLSAELEADLSLTPVHPATFVASGRHAGPAPRYDGLVMTARHVDPELPRWAAEWRELAAVFDSADRLGLPSLFIGAAARAVLYHRHGIRAADRPRTMIGLLSQQVLAPASPYLDGFGPSFPLAVSRSWALRPADLRRTEGLGALAGSEESGLCLIEEPARRSVMLSDHLLWERESLAGARRWTWRASARRLFANWLAVTRRRRAPAR